MPYVKRRRYSRRRTSARKPLKRLAKRTYRRRSARAQSSQIRKLAKHLSRVKSDLKADTSMSALYAMTFNSPLKTIDSYNPHVIVPLTCGISQKQQTPNQPVTTLNLPQVYGSTLGWEPVFQPRDLKPGTAQGSRAAVPPYIKLYKQHCKLRFWAGTINQPTDITVSVLKVRTGGPIGNIKSIAKRLDGPFNTGPVPDAATQTDYIMQNRDYISNDGITWSQPVPTQPVVNPTPQIPTTNPGGDTNIMWNKQMWSVHYQKQFTLGVAKNPLTTKLVASDNTPSFTSEDQTAIAPAQTCPENNLFSEECRFSLNYGGLKLSTVPPSDAAALALDPMVATDTTYQNIPSEHKYFLVISSSQPEVGASVFCPYVQFSSTISTRVPI